MLYDGVIEVSTGTGAWWDCALELQAGAIGEDMSHVTGLLFLRGEKDFDGKSIFLKNIYYSKN